MKHVRYVGRGGDSTADGVFDDSVSATALVRHLNQAELVYIDDPMSFPWEVAGTPTAPVVVDVSSCSPDQVTALRPALRSLGPFDSVIHRAKPDDRQTRRLARHVGVRSIEPSHADAPALIEGKQLDQVEQAIIRRLQTEWQTLVIDHADIDDVNWAAARWRAPDDSRPAALAIRLPGEVIRSNANGFDGLARALLAKVGGRVVVDVWGVRSQPGNPVSRGLVVIGVSP